MYNYRLHSILRRFPIKFTMLKNRFITLCQNYTKDTKLIERLWNEIAIYYAQEARHYHTLNHLEYIYRELQEININHALEFAIFYHDIVYDVTQNDNEEQSALVAQKRLVQLNVPQKLNKQVVQLILETKSHKASSKKNKLFLDADLAILGSDENVYTQYLNNIRKEYAIYEETAYRLGRKRVLEHFLRQEAIYKSSYFYELYEQKARWNLQRELSTF